MDGITKTRPWTSWPGTSCLLSPSLEGTQPPTGSYASNGGPYVFINTVGETMATIGTIPSRGNLAKWKAKTFTIHQTKLRYYQSGESKAPYRDPGKLPSFDRNDWLDAETAKSTCFDDVTSAHVERLGVDSWALKPTAPPP